MCLAGFQLAFTGANRPFRLIKEIVPSASVTRPFARDGSRRYLLKLPNGEKVIVRKPHPQLVVLMFRLENGDGSFRAVTDGATSPLARLPSPLAPPHLSAAALRAGTTSPLAPRPPPLAPPHLSAAAWRAGATSPLARRGRATTSQAPCSVPCG